MSVDVAIARTILSFDSLHYRWILAFGGDVWRERGALGVIEWIKNKRKGKDKIEWKQIENGVILSLVVEHENLFFVSPFVPVSFVLSSLGLLCSININSSVSTSFFWIWSELSPLASLLTLHWLFPICIIHGSWGRVFFIVCWLWWWLWWWWTFADSHSLPFCYTIPFPLNINMQRDNLICTRIE